MIVAKHLVEAPVLDVLFRLCPKPKTDDALIALRDERVQDAVVSVAQKMRELAMAEDSRRIEVGGKNLINYRRFYVGGVGIGLVLGRRSSIPYEWWVFAATNTKPSKKAEKYCAEMRILSAARAVQCSHIGGIAVVGENQPDGRSGKLRRTLDPCGECRDCMRCDKYRHMLHSNTLILTAQPESQVRYIEPIVRLMRTHKETWP